MPSIQLKTRPNRTIGPGHDDFWEHCARDELHLQRCRNCGEWARPVVSMCEHCAGPALTFQRVSGHGTIVSWATFERYYYQGALVLRWDTILVELVEGPLFISNPMGFSWRDIKAELPVSVAFADANDDAGCVSYSALCNDCRLKPTYVEAD